jgi:hypothetical protein
LLILSNFAIVGDVIETPQKYILQYTSLISTYLLLSLFTVTIVTGVVYILPGDVESDMGTFRYNLKIPVIVAIHHTY